MSKYLSHSVDAASQREFTNFPVFCIGHGQHSGGVPGNSIRIVQKGVESRTAVLRIRPGDRVDGTEAAAYFPDTAVSLIGYIQIPGRIEHDCGGKIEGSQNRSTRITGKSRQFVAD